MPKIPTYLEDGPKVDTSHRPYISIKLLNVPVPRMVGEVRSSKVGRLWDAVTILLRSLHLPEEQTTLVVPGMVFTLLPTTDRLED